MDQRRKDEETPARLLPAESKTTTSLERPTPPRPQLPAGSVVGRYQITATLGLGGMGAVYACIDRELHRPVALKVMHHRREDNWRLRLLREAQAMASLKHPNVVTVFDVGVDGDRIYVAMELVKGGTLRQWLKQPRSVREVLAAFAAAGRGLAAAHRAGLVHRDFKPDNVLVSDEGEVLVGDFGLVRQLGDGDEPVLPPPPPRAPVAPPLVAETTLTADDGAGPAPALRETPLGTPLTGAGTIMGTPGYMSPEQLRGEAVDARSDQFAFCAALHEALFGRRFVCAEQAGHEATELPAAIGRVPATVRRALRRGLSPGREERFAELAPLLRTLEDGARPRPRLTATRLGVALAGAAIVVGGAALAWRLPSLRSPCRADALPRLGAWSPARAAALSRRFAAVGLGDAAAASLRLFDEWAARWHDAQRAACDATQSASRESPVALEARRICLWQDAEELGSLVDGLEQADAATLRNLPTAARSLSRPDDCLSPDIVVEEQPPTDPAARAQLAADRRAVAAARGALAGNRFAEELALLDSILSRPPESVFAPIRARALLMRGDLRLMAARGDDAMVDLKEAYRAAERGRSNRTKLYAAIGLAMRLLDEHKLDEAHDWIEIARATSRGVSSAAKGEAQLEDVTAHWQIAAGHPAEALASVDRAVAAARRSGDDYFADELAFYAHATRADAYDALGRNADALAETRLQLERIEHSQPPRPERPLLLANYGQRLVGAGKLADGVDVLERALDATSAMPLNPELVAAIHDNLGRAFVQLGRPERGARELEAALTMLGDAGADRRWNVGYEHVLLGVARAHLGRAADAQREVDRGLGILERALAPDDPTLATALVDAADADRSASRRARARDELGRAIAIFDEHGRGSEAAAEARFSLAQLEHGHAATTLARAARADFVALHRDERARAVDEWLTRRTGAQAR